MGNQVPGQVSLWTISSDFHKQLDHSLVSAEGSSLHTLGLLHSMKKKHRQRRSLKKQRLSAKHSLYLNHNASGDTLNPLPLQMHSPQPQNQMTPKVCATLTYVLSFQLGKHACKSRELVFLFLSETIPIMHTSVTPCSPSNQDSESHQSWDLEAGEVRAPCC